MGRLFLIGALALGAYMMLDQNGTVRISGGGSGGGGGSFSGYAGSSAPAIAGIKDAAG